MLDGQHGRHNKSGTLDSCTCTDESRDARRACDSGRQLFLLSTALTHSLRLRLCTAYDLILTDPRLRPPFVSAELETSIHKDQGEKMILTMNRHTNNVQYLWPAPSICHSPSNSAALANPAHLDPVFHIFQPLDKNRYATVRSRVGPFLAKTHKRALLL